MAVVGSARLLSSASLMLFFGDDFTRKDCTPYLSLVTFLVTGSGNISLACLVTRGIRGALLGYSFVDDFSSKNRYPLSS